MLFDHVASFSTGESFTHILYFILKINLREAAHAGVHVITPPYVANHPRDPRSVSEEMAFGGLLETEEDKGVEEAPQEQGRHPGRCGGGCGRGWSHF